MEEESLERGASQNVKPDHLHLLVEACFESQISTGSVRSP